jgi:cation diffusion facilitator CzcD-associated flavoprotein CzcO
MSVGLIGTGSTGVQLLPYLAREARATTVFQRTPAYAVPLRNAPQSPEFEAAVKSDYARWRVQQRRSPVGAIAVGSARAENDYARSALDVSDAERQDLFDRCWESGGIIGFYLAFGDLLVDDRANKYLADYLRDRIRERVADPRTAGLLLPDYPVMSKRLCADTGYFEAFNDPRVRLVDVRNTELVFERDGVRVGDSVIELDAVVLATGFDAITGALRRISVVGRGRRELREHWETQIRTALGIMSAGFPNLFWVNGPGSSAADASPPLMAEDQVAVIARLVTAAEESGGSIEASRAMEDAWLDECTSTFEATLLPQTMSWYNGGNVPDKVSEGMLYLGGPVAYVEALEEFAETFVASLDRTVRGDRD